MFCKVLQYLALAASLTLSSFAPSVMGTLASLLFVNHVSLLPLQHLLHLLFSVLKRLLPSCLTCLASSSFVYVVFSVSPSQLPCLIIQSTPSFESTAAAAAKSLQSCPTLCDPIDGSPPGSPVPGILQARTLEWGAISFSSA